MTKRSINSFGKQILIQGKPRNSKGNKPEYLYPYWTLNYILGKLYIVNLKHFHFGEEFLERK